MKQSNFFKKLSCVALALIFTLSFASTAFAAANEAASASSMFRTGWGTKASDEFSGVAKSSEGFIVCGSMGSVEGEPTGVIIKYSFGRKIVWQKQFPFYEFCKIEKISGGYILLGYVYDCGTFILKIDDNGKTLFEDIRDERIDDIAALGSGYAAVFCEHTPSTSAKLTKFDKNGKALWSRTVAKPADGEVSLARIGSDDVAAMAGTTITRFGADGSRAWKKSFPEAKAQGIMCSSGSELLIASYYITNPDFEGEDYKSATMLTMLTTGGKLKWQKRVMDRSVRSVCHVGDGYVLGGTNGDYYGDSATFTLMKYSSSGAKLFSKKYEANYDYCTGVVPVNGGFVAVGTFCSDPEWGCENSWTKLTSKGGLDGILTRWRDTSVKYYTATSLSLSPAKLTLAKGATKKLSLTVTPSAADKNVTWKSSDTSVATVNLVGVVTARGKGSATITCTSATNNKLKATCRITVK